MEVSEEIAKLVTHIEENLRASRSAGLEFIDPRHFRDRLSSKQNHIIFGRRGAGKSTLISSLRTNNKIIVVELNLEDYKDITFPNIILQVLSSLFSALASGLKKHSPRYYFNFKAIKLSRKLRKLAKESLVLLDQPDEQKQALKTRNTEQLKGEAKLPIQSSSIGYSASKGKETEIATSREIKKLDILRNCIGNYKDILEETSKLCSHKPIFLILDDFYFISKNIQPDLIDFFHRLTKDTNLFLKIATIKHRSILYKRAQQSYIGVELGHDIYEIDLDYTLDNFEDLKTFMLQLLKAASENAKSSLNVTNLFSGNGFEQLCLASGGVPRDFLSLFVRLANNVLLQNKGNIGKIQVNEEAIANITSKLDALKYDSGDDDELLEEYLSRIRTYVYTQKRTNTFLIAKRDLENYPQSKQVIRELVDLRLIHIIDKNTSSAPSDGRRYEAYLIDVGLYENSRPRNFNQIEPGVADSKSRKDAIRAAPRLVFSEMEKDIVEKGYQLNLYLPEV